tara:strand:+ start:2169 stop:2372 length:204 start_codon:yes stop_codon:yes gene_type:complete
MSHKDDLLDLVSAFGDGASLSCAIRCAQTMAKNGSKECAAEILRRYADHHGYSIDALAEQICGGSNE